MTPFGYNDSWKSHTMLWAMFAMLVITVVICIFFLWLVLSPIKIIEVSKVPMEVLNVNREVTRGDPLVYQIDYCKYHKAVATMTRELVATDNRDLSVMLHLSAGALPLGCHTVQLIEDIPHFVPPGMYKLRVTRKYDVAAFFDVPEILETEEFAVQR